MSMVRVDRWLTPAVSPSAFGCDASHPTAASFANRSAARPFARAFRGINGRLRAARDPSIYSTVPLRPCYARRRQFARRPTNAGQKHLKPELTPREKQPKTAPSEIGAGGKGKGE